MNVWLKLLFDFDKLINHLQICLPKEGLSIKYFHRLNTIIELESIYLIDVPLLSFEPLNRNISLIVSLSSKISFID